MLPLRRNLNIRQEVRYGVKLNQWFERSCANERIVRAASNSQARLRTDARPQPKSEVQHDVRPQAPIHNLWLTTHHRSVWSLCRGYLLVKIAREFDLALENLLVDGHGVVVIERVDSSDHLVGEDSERPPVDGLTVAFVEKHLGRQVLGGPAQGIGARLAVLGEAEVCQFEVPLRVNQDVLWLKVTVDNVQRVQVLEHQRHLG